MAEAVLFSLATEILKSIASEIAKPGGSFASQKIQLLCCAEGELQSLEGTVQTIRAVLLDAEKQQWHNNQVKLWLGRLKDVLYDVHDLLDDVATEDLRRKVPSGNKMSKAVRVFFSKSNHFAHRLEVANKIQELRKKLDRIKNDGEFRLEEHQREETMTIERGKKTEIFAPDIAIIGREGDKKKIKQLLFDSSSSQSMSVVAIVGKGGLGKTALAQLLYNDGEVKEHFGLKMWVCVSDVFDVNLIIKDILKSAKDYCQGNDHEMKKLLQDLEDKPLEQLPSLLHETLGRKKYLLVLDDMWNEVRLKWLELGDWLKGGVRGSKILVTTRSYTVARVTDEKSAIYDLGGLTGDEAWDLFREVAFGDRQASVDQRLEEMGRDIVRKCVGVPLAIRTIGSLLYGKKEDQWNRYKVKEIPEIPEIDAVDNGIMQVLKFSYDHLPSCLKHCFAYCSLFPKDYVYDKEMMIRLWVAQGFIETSSGEDNPEVVADNYLSELLCRSFLDAETKGANDEVLTFKMHDLMHDLAQKVAGGECKIVNVNGGEIDGKIRHVLITLEISKEKIVSLLETSKLRTFFYLEDAGLQKEPSIIDCHKVFSRLRYCRVLGLDKTHPLPPFSFGKLKHLRFLDVSKNESIHSLPDSITDLVNLETLNLSGCENLTTLPGDLRKLVNLRHLLIDGCESLSHMPCGFNHLSSLKTLSKFILQKMDCRIPGGVGRVDELSGLGQLAGSITLQNLEFLQPTPYKCHFEEKERLRSLKLRWSRLQQDDKSESDELIVWENLRPHPNLTHLSIYSCMGRSPPSWLSSMRNLVQLRLEECSRWKHLTPLSEVGSLREMELVNLSALEFVQEISEQEQSNIERPFFPYLKKLFLHKCHNLKGWWGRRQLVGVDQDHWQHDSQSSFPKLSVVAIWHCPNLNSMPLFPRIETFRTDEVGVKLLEQQVTSASYNSSEAAVVSAFNPFSNLKNLLLGEAVDLQQLMAVDLQQLTAETINQLLSNLERMSLIYCEKLKSLSHGMRHLSSLQQLYISSFFELDLSSHDDEHGTQWRSLIKLRVLMLRRLPKLVALPEGIQHVITLQYLIIEFCENLTSLPEWIGNLSSLQDLEIVNCVRLTCLPDGISRLTSLKRLRIHGCPSLEERCQIESGADWKKIAHVECVSFE